MPKMHRKSKPRSSPRRHRATTTSHSNAIVRVAAPIEKPWELDSEAVTILKNAVAKGASDEELKYCLTVSRRYKLDPFKRQIWFVPRWDSSADNGQGGKGKNIYTPQIGIDGLLFMSARDHRDDFGSVSEPEFGPMLEISKTVKAPEWAKVKVFKKDSVEPTIGKVYWEEYAPDVEAKTQYGGYKAPFWRKMPRRMLAKCATALALRQAYPDLGGLYIPEECERIGEDHTENGRQIIRPDAAGLALPPTHAPIDVIAEEVERQKSGAKPRSVEEMKSVPKAAPPPPLPERKIKYQIEVDWADCKSPILRGDLSDILPILEQHLHMKWEADSWWHIQPEDVKTLFEMAGPMMLAITEIQPQRVSGASGGPGPSSKVPERAAGEGGQSGAGKTPTASSAVISGLIEQANGESGQRPRMSVLFKEGKTKRWMSAWNDKFFPWLVKAKEKNLPVELFIETKPKGDKVFTSIVGLKKIGSQEFDDDGKTPVIQNKNREAGGRTLFP